MYAYIGHNLHQPLLAHWSEMLNVCRDNRPILCTRMSCISCKYLYSSHRSHSLKSNINQATFFRVALGSQSRHLPVAITYNNTNANRITDINATVGLPMLCNRMTQTQVELFNTLRDRDASEWAAAGETVRTGECRIYIQGVEKQLW